MLGERRSAGIIDTDRRIQYTKQKDVFPYERLPAEAVKDIYFYGETPESFSSVIPVPVSGSTDGSSSSDVPTPAVDDTPHFIAIKCIANDRKKLNKFYVPRFVNAVNEYLAAREADIRIMADCQMGFIYRCKIIRIVDENDKKKFEVDKEGMLTLLQEYQNDSYTGRAYDPIANASLEPSVIARIEVPYGHYLGFFIPEQKLVDIYPELIEKGVFEIAE